MPQFDNPVSAACPTQEQLEQYVAGTASDGIQSHLAECAACRQIADDLSLLSELQSVFGSSSPNVAARRAVTLEKFPGYSELKELQRGAQGVVYRAVQDETQRVVALKVLLNGAFATQRQRLRFQREVELAARLRHPNIVTVYDSGEHNGNLFYAMEYIEGQQLDTFSRETRTHGEPRRLVRIMRDIAAAVGHAHMKGILHRDLKPANILIGSEHTPHILDFGLARQADSSDATRSGEFLGTLRYASPEQACAEPDQIDIRTDVYSLGVILFEVVTGRMPYEVDGSLHEVIGNIRDTDPEVPSKTTAGIDADLDTIILKCLAKSQERRYQTGGELADDLQRYLAGHPIDARRDSQLYVIGKLIRRYRYAVVAAATVFVTICAALVLTLGMLQQVSDERDKANTAKTDANRARKAEKQRRLEVEEQQALAEFNAYAASIAASDSALRVNDTSEAALHLQRAPESQRGFEWWHTRRRLDTSLRTFVGHTSYVEQVITLRTKPWLISIGWDQQVIVWNRETGDLIEQLSLPSYGWSLATNDAETLLAVGGWDGKVRVWSLPDLAKLSEFRGPADRVMALRFAPGSDKVAAGFWAFEAPEQQAALVLADARTGEVSKTVPLPGRPFWLSYRDGDWLCSTGTQTIVVSENGKSRAPLPEQVLACSSDGSLTAVLKEGNVVELQTMKEPLALVGHTGPVISASFNAEGTRLATCSRDQTIRVWNTHSGDLVTKLAGHEWQVTSAAYVPDTTQIVTASWDHTVRLWDLETAGGVRSIPAHNSSVLCMAMDAERDRFATGARDGTVKLWRLNDFRCTQTIQAHHQPVQDVAFSPDGTQLASASWDRTARIHDLTAEGGKPVVLGGHSDLVLASQFAPDGRQLFTGSRDNTIRVWEASSGRLLNVIEGHDDHIHTIRFHPDGRTFASAGHKSVRLWSLDGEPQRVLARNIIREDYSLAFHPNGSQLVAGNDRLLSFWEPDTGHSLETVLASRDEMLAVSYSSDGSRLVSVSASGVVRIWDTLHRIPLTNLRDAPAQVHRAMFTPDGRQVIGGLNDGRIVIWDGREQ